MREDWEALQRLSNPRDGYVDRYFNRYLSRPITLVLAQTQITPNQVTIASGCLGLLAGAMIAQGGYWDAVQGGLLLQLSVVLDDVDGELARLKSQFSEWGEMLDNTTDTLSHIAVFVGIAVAVSRNQGTAAAVVPGFVLVIGVLVTFAIVTYLERRVFTQDDVSPLMARIQTYVEVLSGRDSSVIVLAFALADRLRWFLYGAAAGAQLFWMSLLVLWWRATTSGAKSGQTRNE